jgi:hypothetical protein
MTKRRAKIRHVEKAAARYHTEMIRAGRKNTE